MRKANIPAPTPAFGTEEAGSANPSRLPAPAGSQAGVEPTMGRALRTSPRGSILTAATGSRRRQPGVFRMTALKHASAVALAVCALLAAPPAAAPAAAQDPGLRIVVLEGEDSINIIDRGTAVQTLVEVRDRDGRPAPGASVLFLLVEGGTATLNARLQQVVLTTNAAGRAAVAVNPTASGAVELSVSAAFGGETATLTVVQSNYATVAEAVAAGVSPPGAPGTGPGTDTGGGTAAGGGLGTGAMVGIAAAAAGAAVGVGLAVGGGDDPPPPPSASTPSAPPAPQLTPGDGRLDVSWSPPPSDGGAAVDDYDVRYRPAGGGWQELPDGAKNTATTAAITGLTNGTTHEVQVRAGNSAGNGPWSARSTGTPMAPASPDRAVLMELYDATNGPNWTDGTNWGSDAPLAEWFGVSTDENGRVTALELPANGLTGTVPSSLGGLTRLRHLVLAVNQLAGEIPSSLGGLASLVLLHLAENRLTGAIPPSLGRIANLDELNFRDNQLTGPIPSTLGDLGSLTSLSLRDNRLTGAIPAELGGLANLRWLALGLNRLTGPIPASLGNLTNLTHLRLHENDLTGSIPPELGDLGNLDFLSLFANRLSGSIPSALCRFEESINPQRDGVSLPGCGAEENADRAVLMELYDATNGPNWSNDTNWGSDAPLDQWLGVKADENGRVTSLVLEENRLTGPAPSSLGNLTSLVRLSFFDNALSGPIPTSLGGLTNLELLNLNANELSGPIPTSLGSLANVEDLRLADNALSGPIPPNLGDLANLEYVNLNVNELSGPIPPGLGSLANLEALWLLGNRLTGPIPAALCRFKDNINPQQGGVNLPCEPSAAASGASLSVGDARAEEAAGAAVAFAVTLSRAGPDPVTVDYATRDGSARAGKDYAAASGTLTFAAGESSKTVEVALLDDAHDEGEETFVLALSNASGARLEDAEATGTIANADPVPAALLARFGRASAEQVVAHVEERMAKPREPGFRARFAGRDVGPGKERDLALDLLSQLGRPAAMDPTGVSPAGTHGPGAGIGPPGMAGRDAGMGCAGFLPGCGASVGAGFAGSVLPGGDLLSGSAFELNRERHGGVLSVWSRGARSSFGGRQGALSLNGDVRTTMLGADYSRGRLVAGLSLARSQGLGGYDGRHVGRVESSATGLYPWLGYRVNDRVSVWGVTGYGTGAMRLTPDGTAGLESGLSMAMAAAGTRGELAGSRAGGGFALAFKADALWAGTSVAGADGATGRLPASDAAVTRIRAGIEGSRSFSIGGRLALTPSVELGVRQDGGDAETGTGVDLGGGLAFTDSLTGLSLDLHLRTLVAHQAEGFTDRSLSLSFGWDPTPGSPRGFRARVAPSWGGDVRGAGRCGAADRCRGWALTGGQAAGRVDAELGYGLPVGRRFVGTPRVGFGSSAHGRAYRLGYRLVALGAEDLDLELGVDTHHRESPMLDGRDFGVLGRASMRW